MYIFYMNVKKTRVLQIRVYTPIDLDVNDHKTCKMQKNLIESITGEINKWPKDFHTYISR